MATHLRAFGLSRGYCPLLHTNLLVLLRPLRVLGCPPTLHTAMHPATRFGCMLMLQLIVFCSCIADGQVASDCNSGGTQATADVELLTSKASAILRFLQESSQIECRSQVCCNTSSFCDEIYGGCMQDACHAAMPPFQPLSTASWLLGKHYRAGFF